MNRLIMTLLFVVILFPAYAQKELVTDSQIRFVELMNPDDCEKERNNKTPMALLHVEIPGLEAANITEVNNFIKGKPIKTNNGWDLWITTETKNKICLKIFTDNYKPLVVRAQEKLESGKKYEFKAQIPAVDVNAGKVYVFVNVNEPCNFQVKKAGQIIETISFTEAKLDTLLHLPYGKYVYSAKAKDRFEDIGSLILTAEPIEHSVILRSDLAKINIISDKGTHFYYDGQEQVASGDTVILDKNLGEKEYLVYTIVDKIGALHSLAANRQYGSDKKEITIKEGTNDYDMHIMGSLEITRPKKANIELYQSDNKLNFDRNKTLTNALGEYTVHYSRYGFEPKTEHYKVGVRENVKEGVNLKRTIAAFGFLNYTYSPTAPIGIMFGYAKRWGVYASLKTSSQFWKSFSLELSDGMVFGHDDDYATSVNNSVLPEDWHYYYVDPKTLEKRTPYRFSASIGVMKSIAWWLYIYAGAGYGRYKTLYENPNPLISEKRYEDAPDNETYYKDRFFSTYDLKGLEIDGGIMIHHTAFNITAGWSHLIGSPSFGDFNVGIGINIHGKK